MGSTCNIFFSYILHLRTNILPKANYLAFVPYLIGAKQMKEKLISADKFINDNKSIMEDDTSLIQDQKAKKKKRLYFSR